MRFSDLNQNGGVQIVRDGDFQNLGFISHRKPGLLVYLESADFLSALIANNNVSAVVTTPDLADQVPTQLAVAVADDPGTAFYRIHNYLVEETAFYGTAPATRIAPTARVHPDAVVAPNGVIIGDRVTIEAGAVIHSNARLDEGVVIRSGAVIGGEGFQFRKTGDDIFGVRHAGGVWLKREVEIQQNSCVDRGLFGNQTEIGDFSKVDNLTNVSHEVNIGCRVLVCAGVMISGSVTIGDDAWIGPGARIASGLSIGERGRVSLGSVVVKDVMASQTVSGNFAVDHRKFIEFVKSIA